MSLKSSQTGPHIAVPLSCLLQGSTLPPLLPPFPPSPPGPLLKRNSYNVSYCVERLCHYHKWELLFTVHTTVRQTCFLTRPSDITRCCVCNYVIIKFLSQFTHNCLFLVPKMKKSLLEQHKSGFLLQNPSKTSFK